MPTQKFKSYTALALVSFFWGTTYLAIRLAVENGAPPFILAGYRQTAAGLILCLYFIGRGTGLPSLKDMKVMVIPGLLMIAVGNGFVTWAEQWVSSGLTAILCSMNPVWVLLIMLFVKINDKINTRLVAGILTGFMGILVIFADNLKDFAQLEYTLGVLAIVIANLGWAAGTVYVSRYKSSLNPLYSAGFQMLVAGIALLIIAVLTGEDFSTHFNPTVWWSLAYLCIFGSVVAYGAFIYLLKFMAPAKASVYSYINTVVAVVLGWYMLREEITWYIVIGTLITIYGIYLVNSGKTKLQND